MQCADKAVSTPCGRIHRRRRKEGCGDEVSMAVLDRRDGKGRDENDSQGRATSLPPPRELAASAYVATESQMPQLTNYCKKEGCSRQNPTAIMS